MYGDETKNEIRDFYFLIVYTTKLDFQVLYFVSNEINFFDI